MWRAGAIPRSSGSCSRARLAGGMPVVGRCSFGGVRLGPAVTPLVGMHHNPATPGAAFACPPVPRLAADQPRPPGLLVVVVAPLDEPDHVLAARTPQVQPVRLTERGVQIQGEPALSLPVLAGGIWPRVLRADPDAQTGAKRPVGVPFSVGVQPAAGQFPRR